ncbi:MAG TPA: sigma-70 family RNA polymerase sigma factor [Blastocatellia bacterium]|nr:sigma-70 family RNA polymerase sigma factor [Blastocatellia bacterium]
MNVEEFRNAFSREIDQLLSRAQRRYNVTLEEISAALFSSARRYFGETADQNSSDQELQGEIRPSTAGLFESINADDLCLALACAKGDDAAWEDFYRDYRSYLVSIARTMTSDVGAAEQLADSTFADLYGLRESGGNRVSKFSFYSGRGSLKGWLRAVVFQLSADHHRQTSRLVQTEEADDLERMARAPDKPNGGGVVATSFEASRYRAAVGDSLRRAIDDLNERERLLIAYYYYDELTLREIGLMFEVHEATISRWLTKVQKHIRKLVEKSLAREHRFNRRQIGEALEQASQELDFSLKDYLVGSDEPQAKREQPAGTTGGAIARQ